MNEIIEKLKTWQDDINCDIKDDWPTLTQKHEMIRQHTQLSMAIGILENLGENCNIPK